jgi:hypothetical protein
MNTDMNKDSPIKIWLDGTACVAKAERIKLKTISNRVKDVIIIRIDGAKDKIVIKNSI